MEAILIVMFENIKHVLKQSDSEKTSSKVKHVVHMRSPKHSVRREKKLLLSRKNLL